MGGPKSSFSRAKRVAQRSGGPRTSVLLCPASPPHRPVTLSISRPVTRRLMRNALWLLISIAVCSIVVGQGLAGNFPGVGRAVTPGSVNHLATFPGKAQPSGTSWPNFIGGQKIGPSSNELGSRLAGGSNPSHLGFSASSTAAKPTKYTITFNETGLPKGTTWSVLLTPTSGPGIEKSSKSSSISFSEPNGTYSYSITPIPGYQLSMGSLTGSVTVGGSTPPTTSVPWEATPASKSGLSQLDYVVIAAAVVAAALVVLVLYLRRRNRTPPDTPQPSGKEGTKDGPKDGTPRSEPEAPSSSGSATPGSVAVVAPPPVQK